MDYENIWFNYLNVKKNNEGKIYSSHTQIRNALLRKNRTQHITLWKIDKVYLYLFESTIRVYSLPRLISESPTEEPRISTRVKYLYIFKNTEGSIEIRREIWEDSSFFGTLEKSIKTVTEETFSYLWRKASDGIDKMFQDFRLLTPCLITNVDDRENYERLLDKAGVKLVEVPENITESDLLENPFFLGDKIMLSQDSLNFLIALKEEREAFGMNTDSIDRLIKLWEDD